MRAFLGMAALLIAANVSAESELKTEEVRNKWLVEMTSTTYKLEEPLAAEAIINKARNCMVSTLRNDPVVARGGTSYFGTNQDKESNVQPASAFFVVDDAANGIISANHNVDYRWLAVAQNVKSVVTLQAKEGRFRIKHSGISSLQKSTGSITNNGYGKVGTRRGLGGKPAIKKLEGVTDKLAACVQESGDNQDDW